MDLPPPPAPSMQGLAAARAAMLAETSRPRTTWTTLALRTLTASLGLAGLIMSVMLISGAESPATLISRWLSVVVLVALAPLAILSGARPGALALRRATFVAGLAAAVTLVLTRPDVATSVSTAPEWSCTAYHVLAALPAMAAAYFLMQSMAFSWSRATAVGLGVGTTGALLGELMCGRPAAHVAVFHLAAWALVTLGVVTLARLARRRSFAP